MKKLSFILLASALAFNTYAQKTTDKKVTKVEAAPSNTISSVKIGYKLQTKDNSFFDVVTKEMKTPNSFFENGPVLFMFSCNTCPFVIKAQQRTEEVLNAAKELNINVVILNANEAQRDGVDSEDQMVEYANAHGYQHYYIDKNHEFANLLGATKTPEVFLFNAEKVLVYKGAMDDNPANPDEVTQKFILDAMQALNNGEEIKIKESKSVGCSIKRLK